VGIFGAQHFRAADFAERDRFHVGGRARDRGSSLCRSVFLQRDKDLKKPDFSSSL
jgi:hypothetical protein